MNAAIALSDVPRRRRAMAARALCAIGLGGVLVACGGATDRGNDRLNSLLNLQAAVGFAVDFDGDPYIEKINIVRGDYSDRNFSTIQRALGEDVVVDRRFLQGMSDEIAQRPRAERSGDAPLTLHVVLMRQTTPGRSIRGGFAFVPSNYVIGYIGHDETRDEVAFEGYVRTSRDKNFDEGDVVDLLAGAMRRYGLSLNPGAAAISVSTDADDFPGDIQLENTISRLAMKRYDMSEAQFSQLVADTLSKPEDNKVIVADLQALRDLADEAARRDGRAAPSQRRGDLWLSSFAREAGALFHLGYLEGQFGSIFATHKATVKRTGLTDPERQWAVVFEDLPAADVRSVCAAIARDELNCGPEPS